MLQLNFDFMGPEEVRTWNHTRYEYRDLVGNYAPGRAPPTLRDILIDFGLVEEAQEAILSQNRILEDLPWRGTND
jgi:hypothetical protein